MKQLIRELSIVGIFSSRKSDFGVKPLGLIYVVEFQKRGLPHVHVLMILDKEDKLVTAADVDAVVSAEFPDEVCCLCV